MNILDEHLGWISEMKFLDKHLCWTSYSYNCNRLHINVLEELKLELELLNYYSSGWVGGQYKTKLRLISTQVKVGVELGNFTLWVNSFIFLHMTFYFSDTLYWLDKVYYIQLEQMKQIEPSFSDYIGKIKPITSCWLDQDDYIKLTSRLAFSGYLSRAGEFSC